MVNGGNEGEGGRANKGYFGLEVGIIRQADGGESVKQRSLRKGG